MRGPILSVSLDEPDSRRAHGSTNGEPAGVKQGQDGPRLGTAIRHRV